MTALDAIADLFFGGAARTSTELQRLWSFRRGFAAGFGMGFAAATILTTAVLVLL